MQRFQAIDFRRHFAVPFASAVTCLVAAGCNPTVKIEAPDKPIEINLNVKIEQEVRVRVDRDLDDLLATNPDLF
ncbi:MAG: YnbE family lipoprotein [Alphaproteobacteria bacterium]|nr:YnbE family lipoprotein [Alphaproteobacteria bacterium]MDX5414750.1 YnbE family lipoprotein [Alphaproteobacteria bacterium]MDX5491931.1 YnbE family lipoprotein [Alphaproteobacteria bacterium]